MEQLQCELIHLWKLAVGGAVADRQPLFDVSLVLISIVQTKAPLRPDQVIVRCRRRAEAADESCDPVVWKAHRHRHRLIDFPETRIIALLAEGKYLGGFIAEQISSRVDTVNADIVDRAAPELRPGPDIAFANLVAEGGIEESEISELAGLRRRDRSQVRLFEV